MRGPFTATLLPCRLAHGYRMRVILAVRRDTNIVSSGRKVFKWSLVWRSQWIIWMPASSLLCAGKHVWLLPTCFPSGRNYINGSAYEDLPVISYALTPPLLCSRNGVYEVLKLFSVWTENLIIGVLNYRWLELSCCLVSCPARIYSWRLRSTMILSVRTEKLKCAAFGRRRRDWLDDALRRACTLQLGPAVSWITSFPCGQKTI